MATTTNEPSADDKVPFWSLAAAISAIGVSGLGFGHSLPLFSVLLESYGASDFEIGLNTAFAAVAALLGSPFYPKLISKWGLRPFLIVALVTMISPYFLVYFAGDQIIWWYPLRFVFAIGGGALFAGAEIWINAIAPDRIRGRVLGIYATCLALGFALGPLIFERTGHEGVLPFLAGVATFAAAGLPILFIAAPRISAESQGNIFAPMLAAPVLFGSAAMFAGTESAMLIFLPILAMELGHGVSIGAFALTVYGVGLVVSQIPVGLLADKYPAGRVMAACASVGAAFACLIPFVQAEVLMLYAVLFIWGGAVGGIYTAGLVVLGNTYKGEALAAANTAFVFTYAAGAVIGPLAAGAARSLFGPDGMIFMIGGVLAFYAVAAVRRSTGEAP